MRRAITLCAAAVLVVGGCYRSHGRSPVDAGGVDAQAPDATPPPPPPPPPDGGPDCVEGAPCDDGDACTTGDTCRGGACAGAPIVCDAPPGTCFDGAGRCEAGECVYAPLEDGTACDDGDACTLDDACASGACTGAPLDCGSPPPDECLDGSTLRTWSATGACAAGGCAYTPLDRVCSDGCVDGECRCVPSDWDVTVVDSRFHGDGGPSADALAVDALGGLHAVYPVRAEGDTSHTLYYAHRPAGGPWMIETLARGWDAAIAVEPDGTPHVIYRDEPQERVLHATRAPGGGAWVHSAIRTIPGEGRVAVGPSGVVHVALAVREPFDVWSRLVHGVRSRSGAWTFEEIDARAQAPLALALDGEGGVHVAYRRDGLRYARRQRAGAWVSSTIAADRPRDRMDLAVDASGALHLVYGTRDDPPGPTEVRYASSPPGGASWSVQTIATGGIFGAAMAMDRAGGIHAASTPSGAFYLARDPGGAWTVSQLPLAPPPVTFTYGVSVDVDGDGGVHLALKTSQHALVHATRRVCH